MVDKEIFEIIKYHYYLQYGCFFSEIVNTKDCLFTFNDVMDCFIWNHTFPYSDNVDFQKVISVSERYFLTRNRKPCIYLDVHTNDEQNIEMLNAAGYNFVDNEAWMVLSAPSKVNKVELRLEPNKILKNSDLKEFLLICSECFGKQYSIAIEREYKRFQVHKNVEHFVFSKDGVNIGTGSLYSFDKYVFVHNVGVKEQYRNNGYAKELMQYLIDEAYSIGIECPKLILQCDGGGFIEDMYLKLGFENIYRRWGYLKA